MELSRKNLFKFGLLSGLASALPAWARERALKAGEERPEPAGEESFASTVCGLCPAGCGMRVRRVDGRAVGVAGIPDHPVNQGGLCPKGAAALQELYHPDRLRTPLARAGPRGSGAWRALTWDEALRALAVELLRARAQDERRPFAALTSARPWDVQGELLEGLAEAAGGGPVLRLGFPLAEFPTDAYAAMHGTRRVALHLARAKLVVFFGFDWLQSHPSPVEAQRDFAELRRGPDRSRARILAVGPRLSVTAGKADRWFPCLPGAEGFLALALAKQLIADGTYDKAFVSGQARGFAELRRALDALTLDEALKAAGVPRREFRALAAELSAVKPSAVIAARGPLPNQLAVHALNALLGNIGTASVFSGPGTPDDLRAAAAASQALGAPPPAVLLVDRANPAFLEPARWRGILAQAPFVAVVSPFLSETAQGADLVLPCDTPLEAAHCSRPESSDGRSVLNAAAPAVPRLHDTKDPGEVFLTLARALGRTGGPGDFDSSLTSRLRRLRPVPPFPASGADRIWSQASGPAAGRPCATRSGRFEFDVLTELLRRREFGSAPADEDFPLALHLYSPLAFSFGAGAHLPYLQAVAGPSAAEGWETWAELHPDSARRSAIAQAEPIWVESRAGRVKARARLLRTALPGVLSLPVGLGHAGYGRWAEGLGSNPLEIGTEGTRVRVWKA